jgi:hypothetical protein
MSVLQFPRRPPPELARPYPCPCCTSWGLHPSLQPQRIRELARCGFSIDAISLITGWGMLAIRRALGGQP